MQRALAVREGGATGGIVAVPRAPASAIGGAPRHAWVSLAEEHLLTRGSAAGEAVRSLLREASRHARAFADSECACRILHCRASLLLQEGRPRRAADVALEALQQTGSADVRTWMARVATLALCLRRAGRPIDCQAVLTSAAAAWEASLPSTNGSAGALAGAGEQQEGEGKG